MTVNQPPPAPQDPQPIQPRPLFFVDKRHRYLSTSKEDARRRRQVRDELISENFRQALDQDPNYAARTKQLANELQMDSDKLHDLGSDEIRKLLAVRDFKAKQLAKRSPTLHAKLEDGRYLFGVYDDLDNLSLMGELSQHFEFGRLITERGKLGRRLIPESARSKDPRDWPSMPELVKLQRRMGELPSSTTGFLTGTSRFVGQMAPMFREAIGAAGVGGVAGGIWGQVGGPLAPTTVPAGMALGATAGFTSSMAVQSFQIEGGNAFVDMLAAGFDRDIAAQAAYTVGSVNAVLEMGGMAAWALPIRQAVKDRIKRKILDFGFWSRARRMGLGTGKALAGEEVTEILQEITNIWQEGVGRQKTFEKLEGVDPSALKVIGFDPQSGLPSQLSPEELRERAQLPKEDPRALLQESTPEEIQERLEHIALETFYGAGLISAFGPAMQFYGDKLQIGRAERNFEIVKDLAQAIQASKAAERAPESVGEYLEELHQNGPNFYFDPREVIRVLNERGLTTEQVDKILPGFSQRMNAAASEQAVELVPISSGDFVRFNRSELSDTLMPILRVDEEGTTFAQAQEQRKNEAELEAELQQRVDKDVTKREAVRKVQREMELQLQAAGQRQSHALYNARAYALGLQRIADDINVSVDELHESSRGVQVVRDEDLPPLLDREEFAQKDLFRGVDEPMHVDVIGQQDEYTIRSDEGGTLDFSVFQGVASIKFVEVPEEARRQGVGERLMARLYNWAAQEGLAVNPGMASEAGSRLLDRTANNPEWLSRVTAPVEQREQGDLEHAGIGEGEGPRGRFLPGLPNMLIALAKKHDSSTFLHELAHYFLTLYEGILSEPVEAGVDREAERGRQRMAQRFQAFLDWIGVDDLEAWRALPQEKRREFHEQFAFGWERHLATSEPPSVGKDLRALWKLFGKWVRAAYHGIVNEINVLFRRDFGRDLPALTPEVERFMNELIVASEDIDQEFAARGFEAQFEEKPEGMSDSKWQEILDASDTAREESKEQLSRGAIRNLAWERKTTLRIHREVELEADENRKRLEPEIRAEVQQRRVHRARRYLRTGETETAEGVNVAEEHKLDTAMAKQLLLAAQRDGQVDGDATLPKNLNGITKKGGVDPNTVYEQLLYESPQQMIAELANESKLEDAVAEAVAERVWEERPDLFSSEAIQQRVDEAIHTDALTRMVALEYGFMARTQQPTRLLIQAARNVAERQMATKLMGDVRVRTHTLAEGRAARAAKAHFKRGEFDQAINEKRQQLLHNQMGAVAKQVVQDRAKAFERWKKIFKTDEKLGKRRDMHLVGAARGLLIHFQLGRGSDNRTAQDYLDELVQFADEDVISAATEQLQRAIEMPRSIDQMTVLQFEDFVDTIDSLWELSLSTKQQRDGERKVELDRAANETSERIKANVRPREVPPGSEEQRTLWQRFSDAIYSGVGHLRRAEHLADSWDGGPGGPMERYFIRPVKQALDNYRIELRKYVDRYVEKLQALEVSREPVEYRKVDPETGERTGELVYKFKDTLELVGALRHNMGNLSNKRKLLLGRKNRNGTTWGDLDENGNLDSSDFDSWLNDLITAGVLKKEHFDFVQWEYDLNEEIRPLAQRAHFEIYGRHFSTIESTPFTITFPDGTSQNYRGGYVPAKTDRTLVFEGRKFDAMKAIEEDHRQSMPMRLDGFTKDRKENYARELSLDPTLALSHFSEALRFALVQPSVRRASRLLNHQELKNTILARDPFAISNTLMPFLHRAVTQTIKKRSEVMGSEWVDETIDAIRSFAGRSIMFANVRNALQQPTGVFIGMTRVRAKHLSMALGNVMTSMPSVIQMVRENSQFMDERLSNQIFDLYKTVDDVVKNPNAYQKSRDYINRNAYFLQRATQNVTDLVVWVGTFNQELAKMGADKSDTEAMAEAAARADTNVRLTQSSLLPEDVAQYEVGTAGWRTLTQFTNFFSMLANNLGSEYAKAVRDLRGKPLQLAWQIFWITAVGFSAPMLVAEAIVKGLGGKLVDDEGDGHEDELSEWFIDAHVSGLFAMVPVFGPAVGRGFNAFNDKAYDDRMMESPAIAALESMARGGASLWERLFGDEEGQRPDFSGRDVKDIWQLIGLAFGRMPTGQIGKTLGFRQDVELGNVAPLSDADELRGLLIGTPAEGTRR